MNTLILDIETSPNLAYVWGLWNENIPLERFVAPGKVLCFTAKWLGDPGILFARGEDVPGAAWNCLNSADAVVTYNGKTFDMPHLNTEILLAGLKPPSPYKNIDLLETVKRQFRLPSRKLAYVTQALGFPGKIPVHFDLWQGCMNNDPESWRLMEEYNIRDVEETERLYNRLLPWIVGHPNVGIAQENLSCPTCGSIDVQRRGYATTGVGFFQKFVCNGCGRWSRSRKSEKGSSAGLVPVALG